MRLLCPEVFPERDTVYRYRVKPRFYRNDIHRLFRPATVVPGLSCALFIIQNLVCGGVLSAADEPAGDLGGRVLDVARRLPGSFRPGHHGANHGVDLEHGQFDGIGGVYRVPSAASSSLASRLHPGGLDPHALDLDDVLGDILDFMILRCERESRWPLIQRQWLSGTRGSDRHIAFGIDNAREPTWEKLPEHPVKPVLISVTRW